MSANIVFNKERSIKACMADAWRMIVLNWKDYLRNLWPYLLIASIAYALFIEFSVQYACQQLLPALLLKESGGEADVVKLLATPTLSNIVVLSVCLVFCIFSCVLRLSNTELFITTTSTIACLNVCLCRLIKPTFAVCWAWLGLSCSLCFYSY